MSKINKFKVLKKTCLSDRFNNIYKLSLPKELLEKMLSNTLMLSYTLSLSTEHRQDLSNMLSSDNKTTTNPIEYIKNKINTPEIEITSRIINLDEEFIWYKQTYNEIVISDGITEINSITMFYFNNEDTLNSVIENIIIPIKLEF